MRTLGPLANTFRCYPRSRRRAIGQVSLTDSLIPCRIAWLLPGTPMPYVDANAIHEAAHALIAIGWKMLVDGIFVDSKQMATTRVSIDPAKTLPAAIYSQKVAGALAVEIQNEREGRNDDTGFGDPTNPDHDAWTVSKIIGYLGQVAPGHDTAEFEATWRAWTRTNLEQNWSMIEAIAKEVAPVFTAGGKLTGERIIEIIKANGTHQRS